MMSFPKKHHTEKLVARSPAITRVLEQLTFVAGIEVSVLLTGPTGSGKTALARMIHDNSPRASKPFVEINCAALPQTLVESELFGAWPGAHSMATRKIVGKVEAAEGGTLFLDEVGDLDLTAQGKLLQLLQSREYYPLGASRPTTADVRILAATNSDLRAAVARKAFREDLFFRLRTFPVRVPSLAERQCDIPELAAAFCVRACRAHQLPEMELSRGALHAIALSEWPGNVRELAHAVEAAVVRAAASGEQRIERAHLFPDEGCDDDERTSGVFPRLSLHEATRQFQAGFVLNTLEETRWNMTETAARLGVARSHVYNLIRMLGLARGSSDEVSTRASRASDIALGTCSPGDSRP